MINDYDLAILDKINERDIYDSITHRLSRNHIPYHSREHTCYFFVIVSSANIDFSLERIKHFLLFIIFKIVFQNNYNVIMDGFKDANLYQKEMNAIAHEVYNKVDNSTTFTKGAWLDFKTVYVKYVKTILIYTFN